MRPGSGLIPGIHAIHSPRPQDSAWRDSERRVMKGVRGRQGHPGNGKIRQRRPLRKQRTFARMNVRGSAGWVCRRRSARRKPNPLSSGIQRNPSLRAKEPRRELSRQQCRDGTRTGDTDKSQDFDGNPVREPNETARNRPEPEEPTGAERLRPEPLPRKAPLPSPAQDVT